MTDQVSIEVTNPDSVYIVQQPEHTGHALHTLFVHDLNGVVAQIADRGLDPDKQETYSSGAHKITYCTPCSSNKPYWSDFRWSSGSIVVVQHAAE